MECCAASGQGMVKFVLLTHPRSGSTLVSLALRSHPEIRMFGELFNDELGERVRAFEAGIRSRSSERLYPKNISGCAYTDGRNAAEFIEQLVYCDPSSDKPLATGFKLFYNQARSSPLAATDWDYLQRDDEIRIVHLIRNNLLEALLSLRTALLTDAWAVATGGPTPQLSKLRLTAEECEAYFRNIMAQREHVTSSLSSPRRRWLSIEYERDLLPNFDGTLDRIQSFLGVQTLRPTQFLRKQAGATPSDQLQNYADLRRHFERTSFNSFFNPDRRLPL